MAFTKPHIVFDNVTLGYERHPAVHHLDAVLAPGTLTAVVGPNGAGKSTLLKGIIGTLRPLEGRIALKGIARDQIAYLPQQAEMDRSFPVSVFDMVAMGLWRHIGPFRGLSRQYEDRVHEAMAAVGLTGFEHRAVGSLSGGQMQRALFARLLLQDAPIILLDEPFNAIDTRTASDLLALIKRWHGEERTVVAVLHDLDQVREHFTDTLLLARELVAAGPTAEVMTADNLFRARQLCEAFDEQAAICARATGGWRLR
ncbi:MAG: ABC transporter [Rhodospirillaceae bacterium BRH_c57]|nr:MAG: ABC transporter [Rhodospirillaceae bacterium BRH_c57]